MRSKLAKQLFSSIVLLVVVAIALHFYLLDGLLGSLVSFSFGDDTVYTQGYSDSGFRKIKKGLAKQDVIDILGPPFGESWPYGNSACVYFEGRNVTDVFPPEKSVNKSGYSETAFKKIKKDMTKEEVLSILGTPLYESWVYSKSRHDRSYRERVVIFVNERVQEVISEFYVD